MVGTRHGGEHARGDLSRLLLDAEAQRRVAAAIAFDDLLAERYPRTAGGKSHQHTGSRRSHGPQPI
jgi:hypothetical protein